jgi:phosphatidylserine synthase
MKLKDYVTLGNLLGGFGSVVALFLGSFEWACYLIVAAYACDVLDGPVARLTRQHDSFGSILDSVCDYITNSICASFLVFFFFWQIVGWHWLLAAALAAFPATLGTIRQARQMDHPVSIPCYWLGLTRPAFTLAFLVSVNSSLLAVAASNFGTLAHAGVAAYVVVGSFFHLSNWPFVAHHGRRFMGLLRFGKWVFLLGCPMALLISLLIWRDGRLFFDHALLCFFVYLFLSWTQIPRADLRLARAAVRGEPGGLPLVHRDSPWRPRTLAPFFLEQGDDGGPGLKPGPA